MAEVKQKFTVVIRHSPSPTGEETVEAADAEAAKKIVQAMYPGGVITRVEAFDSKRTPAKAARGGR